MDSNKEKKAKGVSFESKIRKAMSILLIVIVLVVGSIMIYMLFQIRKDLSDQNTEKGKQVINISSTANDAQISDKLQRLTKEKAKEADIGFVTLSNAVSILHKNAEMVYTNASDYGRVKVEPPLKENDGKLSVQVTYSPDVDTQDPAIIDEQGLIGNFGNLLYSINDSNDRITSCYFASESGIMLQADRLAGYQFDENGNVTTFEARQRPWYTGAVERNGIHFTDAFTDADTGEYAIVCSAPVYRNSDLVGVAGAGMLLSDFEPILADANLSESGIAFIIDNNGKLIITSSKDIERTGENGELINMLDRGDELSDTLASFLKSGGSMISKITLNGERYYISCATLDTIGWGFVSLLPESDVNKTTLKLGQELERQNGIIIEATDSSIRKAMILLLCAIILLIVIAAFITKRLTSKLVEPINCLTRKVCELEGDKLDFEWDQNTGDEIDVLAETFCLLTKRIGTYIEDITAITAEKERIGAELSVATQIQADMLPIVFPPFPERKEFEIYASMTPAKEVGGDFYDFFMIDEDHLAMVIADVSGKGVPAALFMVISKTLIKDHAQMCCSPKAILEEVNDLLLESNAEGMFVTVWLGIMEISTGKIVAANAGHEYPAIRTADGNFELLKDKHGMIVGAMEGVKYKEYEIQLEKGGCLFVYTDGVPEATDANNQLYGTDRMIEALNNDPKAEPKTLLSNVRADVDKFVGDAPQFDDLTMLSIRYDGIDAEDKPDANA